MARRGRPCACGPAGRSRRGTWRRVPRAAAASSSSGATALVLSVRTRSVPTSSFTPLNCWGWRTGASHAAAMCWSLSGNRPTPARRPRGPSTPALSRNCRRPSRVPPWLVRLPPLLPRLQQLLRPPRLLPGPQRPLRRLPRARGAVPPPSCLDRWRRAAERHRAPRRRPAAAAAWPEGGSANARLQRPVWSAYRSEA